MWHHHHGCCLFITFILTYRLPCFLTELELALSGAMVCVCTMTACAFVFMLTYCGALVLPRPAHCQWLARALHACDLVSKIVTHVNEQIWQGEEQGLLFSDMPAWLLMWHVQSNFHSQRCMRRVQKCIWQLLKILLHVKRPITCQWASPMFLSSAADLLHLKQLLAHV